MDTWNWSKVTVKIFTKLQKIYFSYKCCSFEMYIHQRNLAPLRFFDEYKVQKNDIYCLFILDSY